MTDPPLYHRTDWPRLLGTATPEQVALEVLERLRWEGTSHLLALEPETRLRLREYFERKAEAQLAEMGLDDEALERVREGGWLLAEEALEATEQYAAAAAFYALTHDSLAAGEDIAGRSLFDRQMMRFKLAFALGMHDEVDPAWNRRLADFTRQTARLLESARKRLPEPAYGFLCFRLHSWLGVQWKSLREYGLAEEALGTAAIYADEPEDRVSTSLHIAEVRTKLGDPQTAYGLLLRCRDELPEVDEDTRQLWQAQMAGLKMALGGKVDPEDVASLPPPVREWPKTLRQILDHSAPIDQVAQRPMEDLSHWLLAELGDKDPDLRHGALLSLALALAARNDPGANQRSESLLAQAEALEAHLTGEQFPLRRQLVRAQILTGQGQAHEAVALFAAVMPRVHRLCPSSDAADALGEYLIALGKAASDLGEIVRQMQAAYVDLELVLAEQPLGSARRRAREIHQRVIEAGLMAVMSAIENRDRDEQEVQEALGWAWRLVMNNRNVELHWKSVEPGQELHCLPELEGAFHARLRKTLCAGEVEDRPWTATLSALEDYELSANRDSRRSQIHDMQPDGANVSVAFFKLQDLAGEKRPTFVLSHLEGLFDGSVLRDGTGEVEQQLERWARPFFEPDEARTGRGFTRESSNSRSAENDLLHAPPVTALLPGSLVLQPTRQLRILREGEDAVPDSRRPMFDRAWYLFPDGLLSTLPVEMLPDYAGGAVRFGQNRAVTLCLRPVVPEGVRRLVDLDRGWLGLGGVPEAGDIPDLPGSKLEVRSIRRHLEERGHRHCRDLLGAEARADRLAAELAELQPAVLHFAVHGFADATHPEACTLILADCPERPERELLPYRRIRELPLDGVELVVLSACSSLIGRSGRATSMEGLAWAFLSRGVTQVIASRYPVDDEATVTFMLQLYQGLLTLPVADALGRARDVCLEDEGLDPRQVAAWSVWC